MVAKAKVISVFCSSSWALAEPVAGLALAERFTVRTRRYLAWAMRSRRGTRRKGRPCWPALPGPTPFRARLDARQSRRQSRLSEVGTAGREKKSRCVVFAATAVRAEFVANLSAGDEDALRVGNFASGTSVRNRGALEFFDGGSGVRMAQHALWSENDQRLAPAAASLPSEQVEILRGVGGLADLDIVFASELHEALDARAGMFRPLAFVAMRKKQHQAGGQIPFIFAALMNWSMMTCAPLTKSPNCASQRTSASG